MRGVRGARDVVNPYESDFTLQWAHSGAPEVALRVRPTSFDLPQLPRFIPRVIPDWSFDLSRYSAIAVPVRRIWRGGKIVPASELRSRFDLPATLVVTCFQEDRLLERIWCDRMRFVEELASAEYDLCLVPNYSVYLGDPATEHRYNISRSLRLFERLAVRGAAVLPHVSWGTTQDIRDWSNVLNGWTGVRAFSLEMGLHDSKTGWENELRGFKELSNLLSDDWLVIVNGVAEPYRQFQMEQVGESLCFISDAPYQSARAIHRRAQGRLRGCEQSADQVFQAQMDRASVPLRDRQRQALCQWYVSQSRTA